MSIYALKPKFQNLLRPLVRQLAAKGVTANQVTLIACLLSILLGVVLALFPTFSSHRTSVCSYHCACLPPVHNRRSS